MISNKKIALFALLISLFVYAVLPSLASADRESARALNANGYQLYKQKKYGEALDFFKKSVEADITYGQAHYNLACTLGVLRKLRIFCEYDAYRSDIIRHLELTLKYMPSKKGKMLTDSDLTPVHDTFGWQVIKGLSPSNSGHLVTILANVTWYGPAPGAYGPMSGIEFKPDGSFRYWRLNIDTDKPRKDYFSGKYSVSDGNIRLTFGNPPDGASGKREYKGKISQAGVLQFEGIEPFTDDPDDCSA